MVSRDSLSEAQRRFYRDEGYLVLDTPITTDDELASLRDTFARLFREDGNTYDLAGSDRTKKPSLLPQMNFPSKYSPELKRTVYWQNAVSIAAQLLDMAGHSPEELNVRDHCILKPAGSVASTPWHQDQAYWDDRLDYNSLSIWMPFQPVTLEMGCMQFVPKSHKREIAPHHPMNNDPNIVALEVDQQFVDDSTAVACPLPAGGVTIHDARTLHFTTGNRTQTDRWAYILTIETLPVARSKPLDFYWNRRARPSGSVGAVP